MRPAPDGVPPEECETMAEVRAGVDAVDRRLIDLLGVRFRFMAAAARIKSDRGTVRDEDRKAEVIANATAAAERVGVPAVLVGELWDRLVEGSITYEYERWDERRG